MTRNSLFTDLELNLANILINNRPYNIQATDKTDPYLGDAEYDIWEQWDFIRRSIGDYLLSVSIAFNVEDWTNYIDNEFWKRHEEEMNEE